MSKLIYVTYESAVPLEQVKYVFVGEAPGKVEESEQRPFVGKAGKYLRKQLAAHDISEYYLTNVVKVRPTNNRKPNKDEVLSWLIVLSNELQLLQDAKIVALGRIAHWALEVLGVEHIILEHPAYISRFGSPEDKSAWSETIRSLKGVDNAYIHVETPSYGRIPRGASHHY